jgi:hypothetical protein
MRVQAPIFYKEKVEPFLITLRYTDKVMLHNQEYSACLRG